MPPSRSARPVRQQSGKSATDASVADVLKTLAATPKRIELITRGCSAKHLHEAPGPGAWSARDVVAHLRACAEVWGRSIHRMLAEDHPTIRYISPRSWMKKPEYQDRDFGESLRLFTVERSALLETLRSLSTAEWLRGATFTATTLGRDGTVLSYAERIASHEVHHFDQFERIVQDLR